MQRNILHNIIKLMRPKHYIKNFLIFIPLIFDRNLFCGHIIFRGLCGFFVFSFLSSAIYIVNDICDKESDQQHETKKNRPIASGAISERDGYFLTVLLLGISIVLNYNCSELHGQSFLILGLYFVINLGYSFGLKDIPFVDIVLLVSGFLLRVLYGAIIADSEVSAWVCLTVTALSFYLGLGKRRNEQKKVSEYVQIGDTRKVLSVYSYAFLDKFMYVCLTLSVAFYALWSADEGIVNKYNTDKLVWTVPIVILLMMKYSSDIESDSYGDPVDVIIHDKLLIFLAVIYGLIMLLLIYVPGI